MTNKKKIIPKLNGFTINFATRTGKVLWGIIVLIVIISWFYYS
ncbi:hypothetical protein SAMN04488573_1284 [Bacillus sp. 5mfcol3.1]|nr:hypothetical protein SAMN04488573_1284 [Bacillus sp. 5mfcol3.1]